MRKVLSCLLAICIAVSASSQFSAGASATYTYFGGDYNKSTLGFQPRMLFEKASYGIGLSYTYHVPFQRQSFVASMSPYPEPTEHAETQIRFHFQTLDLIVRRTIFGDQESTGKLYGGLGASWMLLKYKEKPKEPLTFTPMFPMEDGYNRSISVNGMLGSEYKIGNVAVYGEVLYSLPTKKRYVMQSFNRITPRLSVQFGVKLPFKH